MRIELKDVVVSRPGQRGLDGVSLTLDGGQAMGVLGPSGSGVSLLLKTAAGLLDPTAGRVLYDGVDLRGMPAEKRRRLQTRTGFMFQDAALWANTTVRNNLLWPLQAARPKARNRELRDAVADGLERLGYTGTLDLRPDRLSFGQQRFVSFLRAVLPGPQALFLDEPHGSLDARWIEAVDAETGRLRRAGTTVIMGSHRAGSWCRDADRLVVLDRGRVAHAGTPAEVRRALASGEGQSSVFHEVEPW